MTKLINENIFDYINYDTSIEKGVTFAIPNEIFTDFQQRYSYGKCAYAYSYYYLSMYLHFYAKYGSESTVEKFTFHGIQKLLGLAPDSRTMNTITRKGGDLDSLGYTCTTTDYPVSLLRLERIDNETIAHHYMYSEEKRDFPERFTHSKNFTVKHPDKMYWRTPEDKLDNYYNGTIYEADNTHIIPLSMFLHALNIPDIGYKGFYVYGFIVNKSNQRGRGKGWRIPVDLFSSDIDMSDKTLKGILKDLEKYGFINVQREKGRNGIDLPNVYLPNFDPDNIIR